LPRRQAYDSEPELRSQCWPSWSSSSRCSGRSGAPIRTALSELTRVSPEIFTAFPGVPKPVAWSAEVIRSALADSFLKAVEAAAEESPLVLVVDDVHAADNARSRSSTSWRASCRGRDSC